jgi:hypothetical protein
MYEDSHHAEIAVVMPMSMAVIMAVIVAVPVIVEICGDGIGLLGMHMLMVMMLGNGVLIIVTDWRKSVFNFNCRRTMIVAMVMPMS